MASSAREKTRATLEGLLGDRTRGRLAEEPGARGRLEQALRGAELAGHDPGRLLHEAVAVGELDTADSVGDVLRWRIGRLVSAGREPEGVATVGSWAAVVAAHRDDAEQGVYLGELGDLADVRQVTLARAAAEQASQWAVEAYGPVPDRDAEPDARHAWEQRVAPEAGYRDLAGIDADQRSLGAPPSPERALHHALWQAAAQRRGPVADDAGRDWTRASDAELYSAREAWQRAQEHAPAWVAEELADTHRLVREYDIDAALDRARAQQVAPDSREADQRTRTAKLAERYAEHHRTRAAWLEGAHRERTEWSAAKAPERDAATAAARELDRRGRPPTRMPEPEVSALTSDATAERGTDPAPTGGAGDARWGWDTFTERLRAEHGDRLDPGRELSDEQLAHTRADEIARHRGADTSELSRIRIRAEQATEQAAEEAEREQAPEPARDQPAPDDADRGRRDREYAADQEQARRADRAQDRGAARKPAPGKGYETGLDRSDGPEAVRDRLDRTFGMDDDLDLGAAPHREPELYLDHSRDRDEGLELGD